MSGVLEAFKEQAENQKQSGGSAVTGISIPAKYRIGGGTIKLLIHFGPDALASQEAFHNALEEVDAAFELDIWKDSYKKNGFGSKGGYGNNGYGNNNGGGRRW